MSLPTKPKIYHIAHLDRLPSVIQSGGLWCDAVMVNHENMGTIIGMSGIKKRRLEELKLSSYPELFVGQCVPFYFCPRSIMLYLLHQGNHAELDYRGGQEPIIHLEADLHNTIKWAREQQKKWAFTLSNAGARYFEDRADLSQLNEINWDAVQTTRWSGPGIDRSIKEGKQAEFLLESNFPWHLVERIGVKSRTTYQHVMNLLPVAGGRPVVEIIPDWYY